MYREVEAGGELHLATRHSSSRHASDMPDRAREVGQGQSRSDIDFGPALVSRSGKRIGVPTPGPHPEAL